MDNTLIPLSHLDTILAQATRIDEVMNFRDKCEVASLYAINIRKSQELCNEYILARIRAERKAGQLLADMKLHGNNQYSGGCIDATSTLAQMGISKYQSHRWQKIAGIPEDMFEEMAFERMQSGDDITTQFFYDAWNIELFRRNGGNSDKPYAPVETITISITDMTRAALALKDVLSREQIDELIERLKG